MTERTHIVIPLDTKEILDEVNRNSKIPSFHIADEALKHGIKIKFRKHLSAETLNKLNSNNNGKHN